MPVYRYKLVDPSLGRLSGEVPGSPTVGSLSPSVYVDITLSNAAYKDDLDAAMLLRGYAYVSTDPTTTVFQSSPTWPWDKTKVITVDKGGGADYDTISAAITAASNGDTILVAPGKYAEQLTVNKLLSIIGMVPPTYSWSDVGATASELVVLNPTITLGQAAITVTSDGGLSVFQNLRVASQHQTGVLDSYGVLVQSMSGSTVYFDNCVIAPEIVSGASPTTRVRSFWVETNAVADVRDCQLGVDDGSNIATEVAPVVLVGTAKLRLLNSRVRTGLNTPGDVSIQDTATMELVASVIEGTLDEAGTNGTTTYIDSASRINAVSGDYTDTDVQTKLVQRSYGLVDTGGQKDLYKLNLRQITTDPSSPENGDVWYNSGDAKFKVRENNATVSLRTPTTRVEIGVHNPSAAITTGAKGRKTISLTGTIVGWRVVADQSTTAVLDVWKANGSIPTNSNTITGSNKPTLTAAQVASGNAATWTTSVVAGDVIILEVESNNNATYLALELEILLS